MGVGLGVGNEKMRKLSQYQLVSAEPPKADMACGKQLRDINRNLSRSSRIRWG